MLTLLEVLKRTSDYFARNGVESPRLNAEHIIGHALGLRRMDLYLQFERPLTAAQLEGIRPLVRRRAAREPLAYVLGSAAFCDLMLKVDRRVLVPRPETEQLVELIRGSVGAAPRRIADLGTGSGALALALAQCFPESTVLALDASEDALAVARENAASTGLGGRVEFLRSEWFAACPDGAKFDVVAANPPYLSEEEWSSAEPEVRDHEPRQALVSGDGGCADLLGIIDSAPARLASGGRLFLETGIGQHERLVPALESAGLAEAQSHRDLSGRNRFVSARKP